MREIRALVERLRSGDGSAHDALTAFRDDHDFPLVDGNVATFFSSFELRAHIKVSSSSSLTSSPSFPMRKLVDVGREVCNGLALISMFPMSASCFGWKPRPISARRSASAFFLAHHLMQSTHEGAISPTKTEA